MDIVETGMVIDNVSLELIECYSIVGQNHVYYLPLLLSVNIGGLPPCRSWPSILCRKKTVYNSTVISQEKVTEVLIVHRIQYCKQLLKPCRCFWYDDTFTIPFPVEMFLSHLPLCIGLDLAVLAVQPPSASGRGWQRGQPVLRGSHLSDSVLFEHLLVFLFLFLYLQYGLHLFLFLCWFLLRWFLFLPFLLLLVLLLVLLVLLVLLLVLLFFWLFPLCLKTDELTCCFYSAYTPDWCATIKQTSVCTPDVCVEPIGWTVR